MGMEPEQAGGAFVREGRGAQPTAVCGCETGIQYSLSQVYAWGGRAVRRAIVLGVCLLLPRVMVLQELTRDGLRATDTRTACAPSS